jgi:hypothetical protein
MADSRVPSPGDDAPNDDSLNELDALEKEELRRQLALEVEQFEGGFEG